MYGMTEAQEAMVKKLCQMAKSNVSFVAGQACDVIEGKPADVILQLKALCALGVLECPETPGLVVPRYLVSLQCYTSLTG